MGTNPCGEIILRSRQFCNLSEVQVNNAKMNSEAVLCMTSSKLIGSITSQNSKSEISIFYADNHLSESQKLLIDTVIEEANQNKFIIKVQHSK